MKIVTFNLRCAYRSGDGKNSFIHRAGAIYEKINWEKPDVVAFQEVTEANLKVLRKLLDGYTFVGQFRNADYTGEGVYTAVRNDTCEVLGFETIWLSPTPYVPGSRYENQSTCPRICLQTLVREKETGRRIRVYDLHLDHISDEARINGMTAVLQFMESYSTRDGFPVVILGDFNATPDSKTIEMCRNYDGIKEVTANIDTTFHNFGTKQIKIDYIFMSDELAISADNAKAWDDVTSGIYLSDHYPVAVEF